MNAKFEKWARDNGYIVQPGRDGWVYSYMGTEEAFRGWNGAIQSLEVTPELVEMACEAYDDDNLAGEEYSNTPGMQAALHAFLSALKEQAK